MIRLKTIDSYYFPSQKIKMIVFDMAGTTINENGIIYQTLYNVMKKFKLDVYTVDINSWHGKSKHEVLDHYFEKKFHNEHHSVKDIVKKNLYKDFNTMLTNNYFNNNNVSLIHPNLKDKFSVFRDNDIKVTLNTGYNKTIQESIMSHLKLHEHVDDYVCADDVEFGRPSPSMILKLMKDNNIYEPNQVIKVGDTYNDILEGINANCFLSVGVLTGADDNYTLKKANYILNSVMDIQVATHVKYPYEY